MIRVEDVLIIHSKLIEKFGGDDGVRDMGSLESAINRPFQTFEGKDLYVNTQSKAAAIIESILINHPFVDGNKRTGYFLMRAILLEAGLDLTSNENEKYQFVISIASGQIKFDQILKWIELNLVSIDKAD